MPEDLHIIHRRCDREPHISRVPGYRLFFVQQYSCLMNKTMVPQKCMLAVL